MLCAVEDSVGSSSSDMTVLGGKAGATKLRDDLEAIEAVEDVGLTAFLDNVVENVMSLLRVSSRWRMNACH